MGLAGEHMIAGRYFFWFREAATATSKGANSMLDEPALSTRLPILTQNRAQEAKAREKHEQNQGKAAEGFRRRLEEMPVAGPDAEQQR